jgi:hypothetical protein
MWEINAMQEQPRTAMMCPDCFCIMMVLIRGNLRNLRIKILPGLRRFTAVEEKEFVPEFIPASMRRPHYFAS